MNRKIYKEARRENNIDTRFHDNEVSIIKTKNSPARLGRPLFLSGVALSTPRRGVAFLPLTIRYLKCRG